MSWIINYSKDSLKFLYKNNLTETDLDDDIIKVIKKLKGEKLILILRK